MANNELKDTVLIITLIFLLAPAFLLAYIFIYNSRKKRHMEEKEMMKMTFESELIKTQLEVQEQTMQTIGADLHDNIGQLLSLTSLTLNSVELDSPEKARQKIDAAIDLTVRSIKELRLLGKLLQGEQLIALRLTEAILHDINWMEKSGQYLINFVHRHEMPMPGNPDKDLIVFRIVQEVLNNIIKHARASEINISLEYGDEGKLALQITDNGVGFNSENPVAGTGMGLQNIEKRARIIGGEVTINSNPGEGASITIIIPYP